jgi:hypothetical protein
MLAIRAPALALRHPDRSRLPAMPLAEGLSSVVISGSSSSIIATPLRPDLQRLDRHGLPLHVSALLQLVLNLRGIAPGRPPPGWRTSRLAARVPIRRHCTDFVVQNTKRGTLENADEWSGYDRLMGLWRGRVSVCHTPAAPVGRGRCWRWHTARSTATPWRVMDRGAGAQCPRVTSVFLRALVGIRVVRTMGP